METILCSDFPDNRRTQDHQGYDNKNTNYNNQYNTGSWYDVLYNVDNPVPHSGY